MLILDRSRCNNAHRRGARRALVTSRGGCSALSCQHHECPLGILLQLRIITVQNEELAIDELPLQGWQAASHTSYSLVPSLPGNGLPP